MGEAKRKQNRNQRFLAENPTCAFCGGEAPATTIEHCPPRAMFIGRTWPEGFEFPACANCNHGSGDHDVLVSVLARGAPLVGSGNEDGYLRGLIGQVNQQNRGLLARMKLSGVESRRTNRSVGVVPGPGQTHQDIPFVKILPEHHDAVAALATKLTKGLYYRETGQIFPNGGCLLMNWFTNLDLFKTGTYPVFDLLKTQQGDVPKIVRSGHKLNHQFECKITPRPCDGFFILQASFGMAFGFAVFGNAQRGKLEAVVAQVQADRGSAGIFKVLQSPTIQET